MRYILAADIGGSNARFAAFSLCGDLPDVSSEGHSSVPLKLEQVVWLPTAELTDTASVMIAFHRTLGISQDSSELAALAVALAGPVEDRRGCLTNGALHLNLDEISLAAPVCILNDFLAQAYACVSQPGQAARLVMGQAREKGQPSGVRAVVGAGTGLGMAVLGESAGRLAAFPSEAGHADFPFIGEEEHRFQNFICENTGLRRAIGDVTLTGRGLALLHLFLTGEKLPQREVSRTALRSDTPTLRWYSRLYGRFCRNIALTTLCTEGLWITGGIAADNPLVVTDGNFAEEFLDSPHFSEMLRRLPVYLMDDKNSGLWGAACAACLQLSQA